MEASSDFEINKSRSEKTVKPLPLWKLFRYSSCVDILLTIAASLSSFVAGTALPLTVMIIGLAITEFSDYVFADNLLQAIAANGAISNHFCTNTSLDRSSITRYFEASDPEGRLKSRLYELAYGVVAVGVGLLVSSFLSTFLWSLVAVRMDKSLKVKFVNAVLHQDTKYHDLCNVTELPPLLINDIPNISVAVSTAFGECIFQMSTLTASLVLSLSFDWILALVVNSLLVLLLIVLAIFVQLNQYAINKEHSYWNLASSLAEQAILSIKTVMAYEGQSIEQTRYEAYLKSAQRYSYFKSVSVAAVFSFYFFILFEMFSLGFWYGGQRFISCSDVTVGDIFTVLFLGLLLSLTIGYLVLPLIAINKALVSGAAVLNIIDLEPEIELSNDADKTVLESFQGDIQLSGVVFSYPSRPETEVLHGIDLHIIPGQTIALVGPSGCGKSTIMKLIPRIYDTNGGNILLDGCNIRKLSVKWLRNQIGIVSQEPDLFNVSIAENIGYGKEGATMEQIQAAARSANAHDFISALPNGYETVVGEGGSLISGGQKQRIAIARALVRDPKILLLDEATSALDASSEKIVQNALDKAREGRTTIIIAHRLSTIQTADVIVGIDNGRIIEMGTHNELMEKKGLYHRLVANELKDDEDTDQQKKEMQLELRAQARSLIHGRRKSQQSTTRRASRVRSLSSTQTRVKKSGSKRRKSKNIINPRKDKIIMETSEVAEADKVNDVAEFDFGEAEVVPHNESLELSYKDLVLLLKPEWGMLILGMAVFGLLGIIQSALYVLASQTIEIFNENDATKLENDLNTYVYLYSALGVVGTVLFMCGTIVLVIGSDWSTKRIRCQLFKSILSQNASFFDKKENGVSILLTNLAEYPGYITEVTGVPIGLAIRVVFSIFTSVVISLYASWVIAFVILPSYIVLICVLLLDDRIEHVFLQKANSFIDDSNNIAVEVIENSSTVSSLGVADRIAVIFESLLSPSYKHIIRSAAVHGFFYGLGTSSFLFAVAAGLVVAGVLFVKDENSDFHVSINDIFLALSSILFTSVIIKDLFTGLSNLPKAKLSASEIYRYISENITNTSKGDTMESFSGHVSAAALFFSYPSRPDVAVLNGLDITVKPGHTLALVGPSGSGKSTVISLLEKFYDPDLGDLQLDAGKDIRDLNTRWLRQQISLVSQEPVLFDMSIAENIRYGANFREVTDEEVQQSAKSANIHDFIISLPEGYNTVAGLKGTQLSGGQKQRIAIARALVRNPKILLLDEATSALDTESEKAVQEALDKAREGRTTIIIAHRLSTIQNADCIAVLYRGKVIEHGTHAELMNKEGAYYTMKQN